MLLTVALDVTNDSFCHKQESNVAIEAANDNIDVNVDDVEVSDGDIEIMDLRALFLSGERNARRMRPYGRRRFQLTEAKTSAAYGCSSITTGGCRCTGGADLCCNQSGSIVAF